MLQGVLSVVDYIDPVEENNQTSQYMYAYCATDDLEVVDMFWSVSIRHQMKRLVP